VVKKVDYLENDMSTTEQKEQQAHKIIHATAVASATGAAALAQISLFQADNAMLSAIHLSMIISLGKLFDREIEKAVALQFVSKLAKTFSVLFVGTAVSKTLLGWLPGIGNAANAATTSHLTELIGWAAYWMFEEGKSPDDLTSDDLRKYKDRWEQRKVK
jgi:uncharacterized protein (DUF697 family)